MTDTPRTDAEAWATTGLVVVVNIGFARTLERELAAVTKERDTLLDTAETLQRYVAAMDAIYNHNEAARAAVIMHFGLWHQTPNNHNKTAATETALWSRDIHEQ
jgi:hypothetical protein